MSGNYMTNTEKGREKQRQGEEGIGAGMGGKGGEGGDRKRNCSFPLKLLTLVTKKEICQIFYTYKYAQEHVNPY